MATYQVKIGQTREMHLNSIKHVNQNKNTYFIAPISVQVSYPTNMCFIDITTLQSFILSLLLFPLKK